MTKAIKGLQPENNIAWFFEFEGNGKLDSLTVYAPSQKVAIEKLMERVDYPITISSISAI